LLKNNPDPFIDAVRQVSFSIEEGKTFTLVGESGSGKSTLALAVARLLPSAEGSIKFNGQEVTKMSDSDLMDYRKQISMMWQNPVGSLSPRMTVGSLIIEPYKIHGLRIEIENPNARGCWRWWDCLRILANVIHTNSAVAKRDVLGLRVH
jgi:ABC-type glutathione transport system ATPase component